MSEPAERFNSSSISNSFVAMETLTIPQLVSLLKSSPSNPDSDQIERALISKHQNLSDALNTKEAARIELDSRCEALSRKCSELEAKLEHKEKELHGCKIAIDSLKQEVSDLYVDLVAGKLDQGDGVIVISDGEEDGNNSNMKNNFKDGDTDTKGLDKDKDVHFILTPNVKRKRLSRVFSSDSEDDEDVEMKETVALKRKRVARVVTSDSEDEDNEIGKEKDMFTEENGSSVHCSLDHIERKGNETQKNLLSSSTPKRKSKLRVVTDSECNGGGGGAAAADDDDDDDDEEEDDDIPIGKLRLKKHQDYNSKIGIVTPSPRRLVPLGEHNRMKAGESPNDSAVKNSKTTRSINLRTRSTVRQKLTLSDTEEDEDEVKNGDSDSEGDSLGGFIVSGSDSHGRESSADEGSEGEVNSSSDIVEEDSGSDVDLDVVLTALRRDKCDKEWEYEAEMLASFAKDPELCLRAVCTLYRQQTSEEQSVKGTIVSNKRGFNQPDAFRASMIAEFLLDGDTNGPLKKSVEELEERFSDGLEYCRKIADRYSKQLFMIYKQKEDPFFRSS